MPQPDVEDCAMQLEEPAKRTALVGHRGRIFCCDWAPSNACAVTGSEDSKVKLWDVKGNKVLQTIGGANDGHKGAEARRGLSGSGLVASDAKLCWLSAGDERCLLPTVC